MIVEALRVRNYKALRDVRLTKMPRLATFVGANGSGKSTLLDVFAFLQECVTYNVESAMAWRGGVDEVFSRDREGDLEIGLRFRLSPKERPLEYSLVLARSGEMPIVKYEKLAKVGKGRAKPTTLLEFRLGKGKAYVDDADSIAQEGPDDEGADFELFDTLAIGALSRMKLFASVVRFRRAIENWHCTTPIGRGLRDIPRRLMSESLDLRGSNLPKVALYLHTEHRDRYDHTVRRLCRYVPGLKGIEPYETSEGEVRLRFEDFSFEGPLSFDAASEGTRKLFANLLMLNEPKAHDLLTIEEPENDLYPDVIGALAEEFRAYADRGSQVLVSTHSPDFVNALNLDEVYWMEKREGYAHVVRAADDPNVRSQNEGGGLMGSLWTEGFFGRAHPR